MTRHHHSSVLILGLALLISGCTSAEHDGRANTAQLKLLVAAIQQYRAANGACPVNLLQLVPKFIGAVPALRGGAVWQYQQDPVADRFSIAFVGPGSSWTAGYSSEDDAWFTDDK